MMPYVAMLSGWEIWIVLIIALLLFGTRIPSLARNMGSAIVELRKGLKSDPDPADEPRIGDSAGRSSEASDRGTKTKSDG